MNIHIVLFVSNEYSYRDFSALKRSVVKNFSMAFLFPICVTALFFHNGQAAYDILAQCIVVEDNRPRQR